ADHGRTRFEIALLFLGGLFLLLLDVLFGGLLLLRLTFAAVLHLQNDVVLLRQGDGDGLLDGLIHRGENPLLHQLGNELEGLEAEHLGKLPHDDRRLHLHGAQLVGGAGGRGGGCRGFGRGGRSRRRGRALGRRRTRRNGRGRRTRNRRRRHRSRRRNGLGGRDRRRRRRTRLRQGRRGNRRRRGDWTRRDRSLRCRRRRRRRHGGGFRRGDGGGTGIGGGLGLLGLFPLHVFGTLHKYS